MRMGIRGRGQKRNRDFRRLTSLSRRRKILESDTRTVFAGRADLKFLTPLVRDRGYPSDVHITCGRLLNTKRLTRW